MRSASIIAPRMRRSANVSNLIPRDVVEAVGGVDEADHAVLHEIAEVDRVRHGGGHAARQRLHEGHAGFDAGVVLRVVWALICVAHPPDPGLGPAPVEATSMPELCSFVEQRADPRHAVLNY